MTTQTQPKPSTSKAVATKAAEQNLTGFKVFTPENLSPDDVRKYICQTATDKEIAYFLQVCAINKLNPFKKEVYLVKYADYPASILTAYEVYLKRAERSTKYAGLKAWVEGEGTNMKGCVEVRRKDWDLPLYHEIDFSEYAQYRNLPNNGGKALTTFWKDKPKTMLKKVAISQGLRLAFPDEIASLPRTREEGDTIIDVEAQPTAGKPNVETTQAQIEHAPAPEAETTGAGQDENISKQDWLVLITEGMKTGWTEEAILTWAKSCYKVERPGDLSKWDADLLLQHVKSYKYDGAMVIKQ